MAMEDTAATMDAPIDAGSPGDSVQAEAPQSDRAEIRAAREQNWNDEPDTPEESADASPEPEAAAPAEPSGEQVEAPAPAFKPMTEQQAFDRALTLHRQGRTNELPPEVQGQIRKWEADTVARHQEEQQLEDGFRDMYLEYLALEAENPAEFARALRDQTQTDTGTRGRDIHEFIERYAAAHPDVSLDNPRPSPRGKTEAEIRAEVDAQQADVLGKSFRALAEDYGVDYDAAIATADAGNASRVLAVVQAVVDAQIAKQIEPIRKAERAAALKEAMADYASKIPALSVSGSGRGVSTSLRGSDPKDAKEAYRIWQEESEG